MDIDTPTLPLSDLAALLEVKPSTLHSWVTDRCAFILSPNDRQNGWRLLTLRTAWALAITARLVEHGIPVSRAAMTAKTAVEDGSPMIVFCGGESSDPTSTMIAFDIIDEPIQTVVNCAKIIEDFEEKRK